MEAKLLNIIEVYSPDESHLTDIAKHFGKEKQVHELMNVIDAHIKTAIANTIIVGDDPKELLKKIIETRRQLSGDSETFYKMIKEFLKDYYVYHE